jgi:hypothetical protein
VQTRNYLLVLVELHPNQMALVRCLYLLFPYLLDLKDKDYLVDLVYFAPNLLHL